MGVIFVFALLMSAITFLLAKSIPLLRSILQIWSKPDKDLTTYFSLRAEIDQACRDIKHDLQADRVSVYEYKNGEVSTERVPFMSVKITSESKSIYAKSILVEKDLWPSAIFGAINLKMMQGQTFVCWNTSAADCFVNKQYNVGALQDYMTMHGTKSFFMFPMLKPSGRCLGFGLVEFVNDKSHTSEAFISQTRTKFGSIGGILTVLSEMQPESKVAANG
jgi:hypothetical protein